MLPVPIPLAFLPSMGEWIVLLVIGLLLFGKQLPQVLKDAGRQIADLKRTFERLKQQLNEDKEFRELSSAAQDLRNAVTAPRRMLEDTVRGATSELMRDVDAARRDVEDTVAGAPGSETAPAPAFEGLTDESAATPGPDSTYVDATPGKSALAAELERLNGA